MTVDIGSRVKVRPAFPSGNKQGRAASQWGTVIYIHPLRRFALVQFDTGPRECSPMMELEGRV